MRPGPTTVGTRTNMAQFSALQEKVESISARQDTFKSRVDSHQSTLILVATASRRLLQSTRNFSAELKQLQEWKQNKTLKDVRVRRFMGRLQKSIKALADMLAMDGCESKPCQHGGTCLPRFGNKYNCLCPSYRSGDNCEEDVDECAMYEGTHAGCQHNGTCINHDTDVNAVLVTMDPSASTVNRRALVRSNYADHMVIALTLTHPKTMLASYKCICDWGYKVSDDKQNPTCVDVDECLDNPCHPGVDCINLPGKFQCVGCPKGYHGTVSFLLVYVE
ncbi:EGF-like domain protein [Necator americanus]|uniref:EGF-like domain protein n=1 Tax=Necator americanus TaxID=51031 RepID=W2SW66_NECAM|nr:EGF-like domain protein [Necator americanus]ETN73999.1 EGF-like domain protein [Necator americanus]